MYTKFNCVFSISTIFSDPSRKISSVVSSNCINRKKTPFPSIFFHFLAMINSLFKQIIKINCIVILVMKSWNEINLSRIKLLNVKCIKELIENYMQCIFIYHALSRTTNKESLCGSSARPCVCPVVTLYHQIFLRRNYFSNISYIVYTYKQSNMCSVC